MLPTAAVAYGCCQRCCCCCCCCSGGCRCRDFVLAWFHFCSVSASPLFLPLPLPLLGAACNSRDRRTPEGRRTWTCAGCHLGQDAQCGTCLRKHRTRGF
ncbi:hypothetical protein [Lysobacter gummosus]|uniref:hypothetical protein n=1 Tax=Lysobacter gummosus TaxID=262324 RepID=UPI00362E0F6D